MKFFHLSFLSLLLLLLSCTQDSLVPVRGPEGDPGQELNFSEFNDFPIPVNSKLVQDESIIIAKKSGWLGRLVFTTSESQLTVYDFFRNELQKFGWDKISEVSSESSLLNYQSGKRFASIQIFERTLFGSRVLVSVTEIEKK